LLRRVPNWRRQRRSPAGFLIALPPGSLFFLPLGIVAVYSLRPGSTGRILGDWNVGAAAPVDSLVLRSPYALVLALVTR
jgi:hypothetical protein